MGYIDISMPIHEYMKVYKNKPMKKPKIVNISDFTNAEHHENNMVINLHTGTHIDAPLHMIEGGETTEIYPLEQMFGKALVVDLREVEGWIEKEDIDGLDLKGVDFVLFRTRNSYDELFNNEFTALSASAAKYLSELDLKGVGIDALGIERGDADHETHKSLLSKKIMIIEGLWLKEIDPGQYDFIVLPLRILGVEGAPARAVLID